MPPDAKINYSTTDTVSSPLDLSPRGEHESVQLHGHRKSRTVTPRPKVTLTSLTLNNVGPVSASWRPERACADDSPGR